MGQDTPNILALARRIAAHLADEYEVGWGEDRERVELRLDEFYIVMRYDDRRWQFRVWFSQGIDAEFNVYSDRRPHITCSPEKSAAELAKDVERRLLPAARALFTRLQEKSRRKRSREFAKAEAGRMLVGANPLLSYYVENWDKFKGPQHKLRRLGSGYFEDGGAPYDLHGQIQHGTSKDVLTVKLEFNGSPEDAAAIVRLLAARHEAESFDEAEEDDETADCEVL